MRNCGLLGRFLGLLLVIGLAAPAHAQTPTGALAPPTNATYEARAADVVTMINGGGALESIFAPGFLNAVPAAQLREISASLTAQYGPAQSARVVSMSDVYAGKIEIVFEKGIGEADLVLEGDAPHRIVGLLLTGFRQSGDDYAVLAQAFANLPGSAGFAVAELTPQAIRPIADYNADGRFAIGSTFKLYVLAELAGQVESKKRKWTDVVKLSQKSLPSGMIQDWPKGAPMTLHSLAALMISISDNTATDTLIRGLGRDTIARRVAKSGHNVPSDMTPFLTTREAFALKMPAAANLRAVFVQNGDVGQTRVLNANADTLMTTQVDAGLLLSGPVHIDTIEWFASPNDLVRLLSHMRAMDNPEMQAIMAISPGVGSSDAGRWRYLGYKGGSETGVMNMTFLGQRPDGRWFAVTGSWNNSAAALDEDAFAALMARLLNVAAAGE